MKLFSGQLDQARDLAKLVKGKFAGVRNRFGHLDQSAGNRAANFSLSFAEVCADLEVTQAPPATSRPTTRPPPPPTRAPTSSESADYLARTTRDVDRELSSFPSLF